MLRDNHESGQSPEEIPIYVIAEEIIRESAYLTAHSDNIRANSDLKRAYMRDKIGQTIRTVFKQALIITSPELADRYPDLGEMEPYRRFLMGDEDEAA